MKLKIKKSTGQPGPVNKGAWWYIATWIRRISPVASGTVGSLGALPFAYVIQTQWGNHRIAIGIASLGGFSPVIGWWASLRYL